MLQIFKFFQKTIDLLYRTPKGKLNHYKKFGGYFNWLKLEKARKEMEKAALLLAPVHSHIDGYGVYFLTGKKYLYQTLFCIQSLVKVSQAGFKFYLIDDGSFDDKDIDTINKLLPGSTVYGRTLIETQLNKVLSEENFPFLHHKRKVYPHIKKLTDIHIFGENEWKLVLDSDMLFWQEPSEMIKWLENPCGPIYMIDCGEAYGYSIQLMEELTHAKIKPLINVGIIGFQSTTIDWTKLELWAKTLEEKEGTTYFLEQALSAMLIGEQPSTVLGVDKYVVNPDSKQVENKVGILHHYVDLSKRYYYQKAWRII